jgi:cation:H+ antiporter
MLIDILSFLLGLVLLYLGAEFLVRGSSRLAFMMRIRPLIIGVTVVAFGTSSPEFIVSIVAALSGKIDVALGNIVGSNIANIGLILGLSAIIRTISMSQTKITREYIWMIASSLIFWIFALNGFVGQIEGAILFTGIIVFTLHLVNLSMRERKNHSTSDEIPIELKKLSKFKPSLRLFIYCMQIVIGIAILVMGSDVTIDSATNIASALGVSDVIIGLSLVAFGTSLPELATAIISILKREKAILIGNIIGSNIFNILFVGGALSAIFSIPIKERIIRIDLFVMLGICLILLPMSFRKKEITRLSGLLLLLFYVLYIVYIYFNP